MLDAVIQSICHLCDARCPLEEMNVGSFLLRLLVDLLLLLLGPAKKLLDVRAVPGQEPEGPVAPVPVLVQLVRKTRSCCPSPG